MKMIMPSHAKNVKPYADTMPLFARYQVESYLAGMFNPTVQLKSGGYIVIGVTEALVAIDVNSGEATKEGSIEETALNTNLEAAEEIARQLRLRDLAGLIVDRLHRHGRAQEQRRRREALQGQAEERPRAHPGWPHLGLRPVGDVAPAAAPGHAGGHNPALPALPRHRPDPVG
jgi:Rne/Rng family ribonuclease